MVRANTGDEKAIRESLGVHLFRGGGLRHHCSL